MKLKTKAKRAVTQLKGECKTAWRKFEEWDSKVTGNILGEKNARKSKIL